MVMSRSVCPHDCPGACALDVEVGDDGRLVRLSGAKEMPYTDGVICAKVGRYEERVHHPERLLHPLIRTGAKGEGRFRPASWDEALDLVGRRFSDAAQTHGPEAVWPYYYAGTMGLVQRDGIERLVRCMGYSRMGKTICSSIVKAGLQAGIGGLYGTDARDMADSDLVVVWGMNPVYTQVNVMTWIAKARRQGAKLVVIDPHLNATAEKADLHLPVLPGTDDALACAMMNVMLAEGLADRAFLAERTDFDATVEAELSECTPAWAAALTGLDEQTIVDFARMYGSAQRPFIRVGYGFTRSRNGAYRTQVVSCLPAVSGAWRRPGAGFLAASGGFFHVDKTLIEGLDVPTSARTLDMSQLGRVLTGDPTALRGGPSVTAMLVQNSNPAAVAPEQGKVLEGLARDDLFLCVHEQFMTDTARYADVVLPATMFLEHPDLYTSYGHTFLQVAKPVLVPPAEARTNHAVLQGLAARLGATHEGFTLDEWSIIDRTLRASGYPSADDLYAQRWLDVSKEPGQVDLRKRFPQPDGRFRFRPRWNELGAGEGEVPARLGHWAINDTAHPLRLVAGPARNFLNSSFTETPTGRKREDRPTVKVHPVDASEVGAADGALVAIGNDRGEVVLHAEVTDRVRPGVLVVESIWPSQDFVEGRGINTLTAAEWVAPSGGAAFHDTSVWLRPRG